MGIQAGKNSVLSAEKIISNSLFTSDFYQIKNWSIGSEQEREKAKGYNDCLCFVFVRNGAFLFEMARQHYDMHTGHIVIDKPDYDYCLRPSYGECTIFNFSEDFYRQFLDDLNLKYAFFFSNENLLSLMLRASPECEYLHFQILRNAHAACKLEMDNLVLELLKQIVSVITNIPVNREPDVAMRKIHLGTVERAKDYINLHFASDISLQEISSHCFVSPFHFSRIFKKFTSFSPHQYLQNLRLKHGEMLLKNTTLPVADIAFSSGFSTPEYFSSVFRQKFKTSPTRYRDK